MAASGYGAIDRVPLTALGQQELDTQRSLALMPWYTALAGRQFARCNVVCLGDSITEGQGATNWDYAWRSRLRDMLRARYPTPGQSGGGRGFLGAAGSGEGSFTWPSTIAGSPTLSVNVGPKSRWVQFNGAAQTITFALTGDSADIMWTKQPGGGTFSWAVDGGSATNVSTAAGTDVDGQLTHISLGTPGPHTLVLARVSGTSNIDGVTEFYGDYSSGIQVHDAGHYGASTANWVSWLGSASGPAAAIAALSPDLIMITLGTNDQDLNVLPATYQANLQAIITGLKSQLTAPYPAIVLNMLAPRTGQSGLTYPWSQYVSAAYAVAAADTSGPFGSPGNSLVTVMDFTLGPRMEGADTDVYGVWAVDGVHPDNAGHQMIADALVSFLAER